MNLHGLYPFKDFLADKTVARGHMVVFKLIPIVLNLFIQLLTYLRCNSPWYLLQVIFVAFGSGEPEWVNTLPVPALPIPTPMSLEFSQPLSPSNILKV